MQGVDFEAMVYLYQQDLHSRKYFYSPEEGRRRKTKRKKKLMKKRRNLTLVKVRLGFSWGIGQGWGIRLRLVGLGWKNLENEKVDE